jgi:hypothetical protein
VHHTTGLGEMDLLFKVVEVAPSGDQIIARRIISLWRARRSIRHGGVALAWFGDVDDTAYKNGKSAGIQQASRRSFSL